MRIFADTGPVSRYHFSEVQREHYPVRLLCQLVAVPASGYYAWQQTQQQIAKRALPAWEEALVKVFGVPKRCYGTRCLRVAFAQEGLPCWSAASAHGHAPSGPARPVTQGLHPRTTDSTHGLRCALNRLLHQPKPTQTNQL